MTRTLQILALVLLSTRAVPAQASEELDRILTLPGIHTKLIGQEFCIQCHDETQRTSDTKCLDCHEEVRRGMDRGSGYHYNVVIRDEQTCESCHKEHRGEGEKLALWFDEDGMRAFDHEPTGYRLEEAHAEVECRKCHRVSNVGEPITQRTRREESLLGLRAECRSCHQDLHEGKLGADCEQCHGVGKGTELVDGAPFDHDRTDYALAGGHVTVDCRKCHGSGRSMDAVPFGACTDCHEDSHQGQLADRPDEGRCDACHDLHGFTPSLYELADHNDSRYKVTGAHRAVACTACHLKERIGGRETVRLDIAALDCESCHADDVPPGHVAEIRDRLQCEDCHTDSDWRNMVYDHSRTEYALTGSHRETSCLPCHQAEYHETSEERICYVHVSTDCIACHDDVHVRQFPENSCESCHTTENWKPETFDHQVNSTYALEGKHRDVSCEGCHRIELTSNDQPFRRFKPLSSECETCHGADGSVLSLSSADAGATGASRP